ncbi:MAG: hypothetical protein LBF81_01705 [Prevotellaceae bacterium]|jgi:hypothetical protein|nr:hypothetical protein [Prevotellaceae bacterium]
MRTKIFFFAMFANVAASATVMVTPISTDYATKKVTFKVAWTNTPTAPYNNCVRIWIDFCPINGVMSQSFSTATVISPVKIGGNGTITNITTRGFFIEYNATNTGTTVTATLDNAPAGKFNWCAYSNDYPPNVIANTNGSYTLAGTPPFELIAANGNSTQMVTGKTIAASDLTLNPATITDATGYPGLWCPYTGNDLYMDADHRCRQRQSGAKNWEAWIKDSRDAQVYRIVQFSDGSWWFVNNLNYAPTRTTVCDGMSMYNRANKNTSCPSGWRLHTLNEAIHRWTNTNTVFYEDADPWGGGLQHNPDYIDGQCRIGTSSFVVSDCTCHLALHTETSGYVSFCNHLTCNEPSYDKDCCSTTMAHILRCRTN